MSENLFGKLNSKLEPIPAGLNPKLPKLKNIEAVIFDIYGTLVVSGTGDISIAQTIDKENELQSILGKAGIFLQKDTRPTERFYSLIQKDHAASRSKGACYPEVDILEIWSIFLEELHEEGFITQLPEEKALRSIAIQFECAVNPVWPMPGMEQLLESLTHKGIPTGIVSNAQFYTPLMLESFTNQSLPELGFREELCVWSYRERLGKPSAELFDKMNDGLRKFGIAPGNAIYLGNDMLNDIWTADQAGLRTCLFAGDKRSLRLRETDERCKDLQPDAVLTELSQIWEVI